MPERQKPPRSGLSTKILVFVFCSTLVTAFGVGGVALHTLHGELSQQARRDLARAADRAAAGLGDWNPAEDYPVELAARLAEALASAAVAGAERLLGVAAEGRVVVAAPAPGDRAAEVLPAPALAPGTAARSYRAADGRWVVAAPVPLPAEGYRLVAEGGFERIHAPVLRASLHVFLLDAALVLLLSALAYRITTRALRPIEQLSEAARRIAQGQFDHEIPAPDTHDEIGLLARTVNDMMRRLRGYQGEIEAANRVLTRSNNELKQAKETFEQLSITDGLTRLHNHRFFQDHLTREIKRVARSGEPLSMLLVDIDDFKALNDRFGHAAGDELLMGLARILEDAVRESDLLARYGGEEFVVLTSSTDLQGAYQLAEKTRTTIAENSFILDDSLRPVRVTVSIGVAQYRGNRKSFFQAADRALYRAKAEGKNCVIVEEEPDPPAS